MADPKRGELPRIPELAEEFEFVEEIGRGGTSIVYLARDVDLGRDVAIKLIRPSYIQDEDALARLLREARTVGKLQHPGIVMLLGTRRLRDHGLALILQYVSGVTLKQRIESEGPLPFRDVERILRDLGGALVYAHAHRIVHRDIKPENIYLDESYQLARLADFGLARAWDSDSGLTLPGTTIGTPTYMSPEQVDGADLDGRSDVYSLGLVGWEMLTGRQPWAGESLYSVIYKQKHDELPPVSELRPDTPENLRRAIEGAIRKDRDERWKSAQEFLHELERGSTLTVPAPAAATERTTAAPRPEEGWESPLDAVEAAVAASGSEDEEVRERKAPVPPIAGSRLAKRRKRRRPRRTMWIAAGVVLLLAGTGVVAGTGGLEGLLGALGSDVAGEGGSGDLERYTLPEPPGGPDDGGPEPVVAGEAAGAPAALEILGGNEQEGAPGATLPLPLVARVVDTRGRPAAGVPVLFDVLSGGGSAQPERGVTDEEGIATTRWTLGESGGSQTLLARAEGVYDAQVAFGAAISAPVEEEPEPAGIEVATGAGQEGTVGAPLDEPLAVRVVDESGDPVEGVPVQFSVPTGGGRVEPATASTDAQGIAQASWVLGGSAGPHTAVAVVPGVPGGRVTFEAVAAEPRLAVRAGVAVGGTHSCSLGPGGDVLCWGANGRGQLGDGSTVGRAAPAAVGPSVSFTRIASGLSHVCGLDPEGAAYCWGANDSGQLGSPGGAADEPRPVDDDLRFTQISAGVGHTCGLTRTGGLHCWGANEAGQLGDGTRQARGLPTPVRVDGAFRAVAAGWRHTCALDGEGRAYCWGAGDAGQLGSQGADAPVPTPVATALRFQSITAGNSHTCGLALDGRIHCWGSNEGGQLGDGTTARADSPRLVESPETFSAVTAGGVHTCALTTDGVAQCWGTNLYGQLGDGTTESRSTPAPVAGSTRFAHLDALGSHNCGRTTGGDVLCWGFNVEGQLGDGTRQNRTVPTPVTTAGE